VIFIHLYETNGRLTLQSQTEEDAFCRLEIKETCRKTSASLCEIQDFFYIARGEVLAKVPFEVVKKTVRYGRQRNNIKWIVGTNFLLINIHCTMYLSNKMLSKIDHAGVKF
jgi:hypothetical protein